MSTPRKFITALPSLQVVFQITGECLAHRTFDATRRHADVMPVAAVADGVQLVLQMRNLGNAGAAKKIVGNLIVRDLSFAKIESQFAVLGLAACVGHWHRRDATNVRSPSATATQRLRSE